MKMQKLSGRLIGGLIVLALGVLLLLDSLLEFDFDVWEVVGWIASIGMIVVGLGILVAQRFQRFFFPLVLIIAGAFILLGNLERDAWQYWPVVLIIVGIALIFGTRRRRAKKPEPTTSAGGLTRTTVEDDVNISCTLGEANERVESQDFRGGNVNITMGNVGLDLRDAVVANPPATLTVNLTMAGLVIRVPSDWNVSMDNVVTMGETEDKRARVPSDAVESHLVVSGKVTMGSLSIED